MYSKEVANLLLLRETIYKATTYHFLHTEILRD